MGGASPECSCYGCPVCRRNAVATSSRFNHPAPGHVDCIEHGSVAELQHLFRVSANVVFVSFDGARTDREQLKLCLRLVQQLAGRGVDEFAVPEAWKVNRDWKRVHDFSTRRFVVSSPIDSYDFRRNDLRLPRAAFLLNCHNPEVPQSLINMDRPFHIICAPENAIEPGTLRKFFSVTPHIRDYDLIQRLGQ